MCRADWGGVLLMLVVVLGVMYVSFPLKTYKEKEEIRLAQVYMQNDSSGNLRLMSGNNVLSCGNLHDMKLAIDEVLSGKDN